MMLEIVCLAHISLIEGEVLERSAEGVDTGEKIEWIIIGGRKCGVTRNKEGPDQIQVDSPDQCRYVNL